MSIVEIDMIFMIQGINNKRHFALQEGDGNSIADMLRATAEEAMTQTGFVFDENTGMYYDHSTGFYYDSVCHVKFQSSCCRCNSSAFYFWNL